ncbi:MAG TPA: hypothetical protein VEH62_00750, partial [Gemmatimonadales bacterium]|nr:hypothetical protein [Gemmatimonadales bacterium]
MSRRSVVLFLAAWATLAAPHALPSQGVPRRPTARPTLAQARAFVDAAERELAARSVPMNRAAWLADNFITDDTESLSAYFQTDFGIAVRRL